MLKLLIAVTIPGIVSFLCSIIEAALYSVPASYVEKLRKEGSKSGELLHQLRSNIQAPITAVLTLNTIASIAGAAIAGAVANEVLDDRRYVVIFTILFTAGILIFSEIIPKTLGISHSRSIAPILARPVYWMVWLMRPLITVIGIITRLLTPSSDGKTDEATVEDIQAMVSLSRKSGEIQPFEEVSIHNILSLDEKQAQEIMTPRTVTFSLSSDITVSEAAKHPQFQYYSRIPVHAEDPEDIVGIVSRRSVLQEVAADRHDTKLSDLTKPAHFVLESMPLDKLLQSFLSQRSHLFVVLDEYGGMAGLVSLEDVLEEILGQEIVDETDQTPDLRELAKKKREQLLRNNKIKQT